MKIKIKIQGEAKHETPDLNAPAPFKIDDIIEFKEEQTYQYKIIETKLVVESGELHQEILLKTTEFKPAIPSIGFC